MWALAVLFWISVGLILYHLIGYPLLLWILNKITHNRVRKSEEMPFVTVITPAYNEGGLIRQKILSVLNSQYPADRLEMIVVDDGSSDNTIAQALTVKDPRLMVERNPQRGGKMSALKRGVQLAHGEILVISDADFMLHPMALHNLMANFADPRVGCAAGRKVLLGKDETIASEGAYAKYEAWIKTLESHVWSTTAADGLLLGLRRDVFSQPDQKIINDDFLMVLNAARLGYRAIFEKDAIAYENYAINLQTEYIRKSRIAAGRWQLIQQTLGLAWKRPWFVFAFVSHKLLRLFIFPFMMAALLSNLGAVAWNQAAGWSLPAFFGLLAPWAELFLAGQVLFYLLAALGAMLDRLGMRVKPLYLLYYFLSAQVAALSGFFRFSSGQHSVLWHKEAR